MTEPKWGPTGETVYTRTYQRPNPDGTRETWADTVNRVVTGNLGLVYGEPDTWSAEVQAEAEQLRAHMGDFRIIPAGRHLWASGVPGRQYLFNCHVSGWSAERLSTHFEFSFMRLMEGGGVGANYSSRFLEPYGRVRRALTVHVVCDPAHPDYTRMRDAGLLSNAYSHEWTGAFAVEDSREGWAAALVDLIDTYMSDTDPKHVDRVYDVSRVRAEGQPLRTFGGTASGPGPFARMMNNIGRVLNSSRVSSKHITPLEAMEIDHEIGACVVAGGVRRSARMSMVHWADPHVFDFIDSKSDPAKHWTTNISVEIDEHFIRHLRQAAKGAPAVGKRKLALDVHRAVVTGMLANGEPGYWNKTLSNEGEPTEVVTTNPCGEIALTEWENCNLGHVNLDAFAGTPDEIYDIDGMAEAHRLMTRFLIRATFGDVTDPKQADRLAAQRRIGVGHFGVQGFLAKRGIPFTQAPLGMGSIPNMLRYLRQAVRDEARAYAFALRIPEPVKVTTVAPTGSIAKMPGRTEGIHPVYARYFIRRVRFSSVDPVQWAKVMEYAAEGYTVEPCQYAANTWVVEFPTKESLVEEVEALGLDPNAVVQSADEIPLGSMLAFQAMYQEHYADNAVSFTANVPEGVYTVDGVMELLTEWLPNLKGTTIMPDGTRPQAPYERLTLAQWREITAPTVVADSVDEECSNGACPIR
ncbi:ribonucleoside-triphosphate reductase, adenosylcobalamin-dependent [Asanoa sp. WMMD1127]|uniref:ribonucleoside-triphosphate reductase, adenosylcobalamin-dependent n=1 Tax=Asanoa sp. WMMD1127 TaxID=3016107 RepID=UPI002415B8FC|nr:ribonucleoside-triphosphate reductase, adenosylcobalamin-dependent [Asanoa sp. WMMD1127]MDG4825991.1 ribonucleoside-triphosphate reductase, adenosylcobalamin-dependent [Asanoa sp. WMMD1127]